MTLTPEQIAKGWKLHDGSDVCPIKDDKTVHNLMFRDGGMIRDTRASVMRWRFWGNDSDIIAYRIIEAHGADAEPARPTPFPRDYSELVWDADGWSQTIIVDGKRPEWLRDDDLCIGHTEPGYTGWPAHQWGGEELAIRVRRREPKRETVTCLLISSPDQPPRFASTIATIDLIDGKPDLSTLKIAEDAL